MMKAIKHIIIFAGMVLLISLQVLIILQKAVSKISIYPDWRAYLDKETTTIVNNEGFFVQITPNQDRFYFEENHIQSNQKKLIKNFFANKLIRILFTNIKQQINYKQEDIIYNYQLLNKNSSININRIVKSPKIKIQYIGQTFRLCEYCYLIDQKERLVFTKKNVDIDIVLKRKIVEKDFDVISNIVHLSPSKSNLVILNAISKKSLTIPINKPTTIYFLNDSDLFELKTGTDTNQRNTFSTSQQLNFL